MKKRLFHLLCLSALVYLVLKVDSFSSGWRFALACGVVIYSCIVSCHLREALHRIPTSKHRKERRDDGSRGLVSEMQVVSEGSPQANLQDVRENHPEAVVAAGGVR